MSDYRMLKKNLLVVLIILLLVVVGRIPGYGAEDSFPEKIPFEAYGVLVNSGGCLLFAPGGEMGLLLNLDEYGDFEAGDTVCVAGLLVMGCATPCPDAIGCVEENSITDADFYYSPMVPAQVIISLLPDSPIDSLINLIDGFALDSLLGLSTYLVAFPDTFLVGFIIDFLEHHPDILFIQPNYLLELPEIHQISQSFPDQGQPTFLDGTEPISFYTQPGVNVINSDTANMIVTGEGVVVAIIDNGLDFDHPLFENSLVGPLYDFIDFDTFPAETEGDLYGHGTFVAGLVRLISPGAEIMPLRAFDSDGYGNAFTVSRAIYWAIDQGADIINMSFGFESDNPIIAGAVEDAVEAGLILVAAAGNNSRAEIKYPAAYPEVLAVTSLDTLDYLADFANCGPGLDVCAPGVNVYSSLAGEYFWGFWSGTSFSAPMASGTIALVLEKVDSLIPAEMLQHIRLAAEQELQWGQVVPPDNQYGYGALDAFSAVLAWSRGDVNNSGDLDIADITHIIAYLYLGGPPPTPVEVLADCNCDGSFDIADITVIIRFLYLFGDDFRPCYPQ